MLMLIDAAAAITPQPAPLRRYRHIRAFHAIAEDFAIGYAIPLFSPPQMPLITTIADDTMTH